MSGSWGEIFNDEVDKEMVVLTMSFRTGGAGWETGTFVQNYMSIEDPYAPGHTTTFTCSAEYKPGRNANSDVHVKTFYGPHSLQTSEAAETTWD